jgi:hypothetical protein
MRNSQHKVYIPSSARENQYLMAKIPLSDAILAKYSHLIDENSSTPYEKLYQTLSELFFSITTKLAIESTQFIANDKFARVRFSPEKVTTQTKQQVLFLYNPKFHTSQNAFYNGYNKAKKLTLVFLSNGEDIRVKSAKFHQIVTQAIKEFSIQVSVDLNTVRVCDHQHLTYDLYAKNKGFDGSQAHKFRSMTDRYLADEQPLPVYTDSLTYAIVDFPINRRVRALIQPDNNEQQRYNALYSLISDTVIICAKNHNINNGAVIANGLVPIVRKGQDENVINNGELLMLGYNPTHVSSGFSCRWDPSKLVDTVQLIFVASELDKNSHGYGKFVNNIEHALRDFADKLDFVYEHEEMLIRLHQHIGFHLTKK